MSAMPPIATFGRCIGPTGSIDLTEMPVADGRKKRKTARGGLSEIHYKEWHLRRLFAFSKIVKEGL